MRFYPDIPARRFRTIVRDALVLILLVCFALLGLWVHDAVDRLAVLGRGVHDAGAAVQGGFETAAEAVDDAPLVGGELAGGLRSAGEGTGGNVAELGTEGENAVHRLANLLGVLFFALPAAWLAWWFAPRRLAQIRSLTEASRVLAGAPAREVAMRAAFSLPFGTLLAYTRDPLGDLQAERYDALVAAAFEDAGLRAAAATS